MSNREVILDDIFGILVKHQTKIKSIQAAHIDVTRYDSIGMDTEFEKDLELDSLDQVEILMAIEEICDKGEILEEEANKFKTFGDIYNYVLNNHKKDAIYNIDFTNPEHHHENLIAEIRKTLRISDDKLNNCKNIDELIKEARSLINN